MAQNQYISKHRQLRRPSGPAFCPLQALSLSASQSAGGVWPWQTNARVRRMHSLHITG
jgi:hypothetical protein